MLQVQGIAESWLLLLLLLLLVFAVRCTPYNARFAGLAADESKTLIQPKTGSAYQVCVLCVRVWVVCRQLQGKEREATGNT